MMEYLGKLEKVAQAFEAKHEPFALFGLFMREDSSGGWDLVVSAPWLEEGKLVALGKFSQFLVKEIGEEAVLSFSRIVTLNQDDPTLHAILDKVGKAPLPLEKEGRDLFGLPIERALILRASSKQALPPKKRMPRTIATRRHRSAARS